MRFQIDFGLDNDAFATNHAARFNNHAVAETLESIAARLLSWEALRHGETGPVYDVNGNRIGEWRVALDATP